MSNPTASKQDILSTTIRPKVSETATPCTLSTARIGTRAARMRNVTTLGEKADVQGVPDTTAGSRDLRYIAKAHFDGRASFDLDKCYSRLSPLSAARFGQEATVFRVAPRAPLDVTQIFDAHCVAATIFRNNSKFVATLRYRGFEFRPNDQEHFRYGPRGMQERSQLHNGTIRMYGVPGRSALVDVCLPTDFTQNDAEVSE